jgi:hypothetical protein
MMTKPQMGKRVRGQAKYMGKTREYPSFRLTSLSAGFVQSANLLCLFVCLLAITFAYRVRWQSVS